MDNDPGMVGHDFKSKKIVEERQLTLLISTDEDAIGDGVHGEKVLQ